MTASPVLTAGPIEGYIIYRDITERKRAEALIAGETRLLEMIAKGEPLPRTLEALCRLVEQESPGAICSIMFVDDERQAPAARAWLPASRTAYTSRARRPADRSGGGPLRRRRVPAGDGDRRRLSHGSLPAELPAIVASYGLRACWSVPILSRDRRVLGTFALYYR